MTGKAKVVKKLAARTAPAQSFSIQQPERSRVALEVTGTAPLIQNRFSSKAIEEMLAKHMGHSVQKSKKNPRELITAATIRNEDGIVSIPPTAFKKGMLTAATSMKGLKKTQLRQALFVIGQSIPIEYEGEMIARMDMVRTSGIGRTPDVRFRPQFDGWTIRLVIEFDENTLSVQTVVDLLNRAGSVGVGEWRPEKDGSYGTYQVTRNITDAKEVAEVMEACSSPIPAPRIPSWAMDMDIKPEDLTSMIEESKGGKSSKKARRAS